MTRFKKSIFLMFILSSCVYASDDISVLVLSKFHPQTVVVETDTRIFTLNTLDTKVFNYEVESPELMTVTVEASTGEMIVRHYSGSLSVYWDGQEYRIVNKTNIEDYVAGVVVGEMGSQSHPEMKKALAILARTYALKRQITATSSEEYEVSDLAYHQVYLGHSDEVDSAYRYTIKTSGQVLKKNNHLIDAVYHAACGRRLFSPTEIWGYGIHQHMPELPPMMAQPEPWSVDLTVVQLEQVFHTSVAPTRHVNDHALQIQVGETTYSIDEFRLSLNRQFGWNFIPSNDFDIQWIQKGYRFTGYGRGHLVGACQVQANQLAEKGWSASRILKLFYPRAEIVDY